MLSTYKISVLSINLEDQILIRTNILFEKEESSKQVNINKLLFDIKN